MEASCAVLLAAFLSMGLAAASTAPAYAVNTTDAGFDQVVDWGDTVTLDGSASFGTSTSVLPVSQTWSQLNRGYQVTFDDPNALVTTFTTPPRHAVGENLTFFLDATYASGASHRDHVVVTTRPMRVMTPNEDLTPTLVANMASGATLKLSDRTYAFDGNNEASMVIGTGMKIKGPATITGNVDFIIDQNGAAIEDVTFRDMVQPSNTLNLVPTNSGVITVGRYFNAAPRENISITDNTFENTETSGIVLFSPQGSLFRNVTISNNTLVDIGRNVDIAPGQEIVEAELRTAIAGGGTRADGLFIQNNVIRNPTYAGINLGDSLLRNTHVSGNTISNMPASGIQHASQPGRDYAGEVVYIYENEIAGANNSQFYLKVANVGGELVWSDSENQIPTPKAAILVWAADNRATKIYDNVVRDGRNGLLICQGGCGVHQDFRNEVIDRFTIAEREIEHTVDVYNNSFISNSQYDIVNLSPTTMTAGYNYWGDENGPYASLATRVQGSVNYLPSYADQERATLRLISSDISANPQQQACSAVGSSISFDIVTGGESGAVRQSVTNVGNLEFDGLRVRAGQWLDASGNEYRTLSTQVKIGGQFVDLVPGQFAALDAALPAPGSSSDIEFKVVHSGRVLPTGAGSLSQVISFFASCG